MRKCQTGLFTRMLSVVMAQRHMANGNELLQGNFNFAWTTIEFCFAFLCVGCRVHGTARSGVGISGRFVICKMISPESSKI